MRVQNKTVPIIAVPESGNRCHVFILDTYLGKLSPEAIERDTFYVQPIANCDLSKSWFTVKPVGKNTLGKMVKEFVWMEKLQEKKQTIVCVQRGCQIYFRLVSLTR